MNIQIYVYTYIYICIYTKESDKKKLCVNGMNQVFLYFLFYLYFEMSLGIRKLTLGLFSSKILFLIALKLYVHRFCRMKLINLIN